jgi:sugar lactone lactonase YvrE
VVTKFYDASLSNGIGWNVANDTLYQIDTYSLKLYSYAYDKGTGKITNQEPFIDFSKYAYTLTFADGTCTDSEGRLYVAMFNGQSITCWDPKTKELLLTIKIPKAKRITSCCFGGPNYEWLFVTSSKLLITEEELVECTNSGAVFVIKDLGAHGTPSNKFKPKK